MKTIQVEVSQKHIDEGQRVRYAPCSRCDNCPVTRAIREATGQTRGWAALTSFRFEPDIDVDLPREARDFIDDFDAGRPVSPFSFPLDVSDEVLA